MLFRSALQGTYGVIVGLCEVRCQVPDEYLLQTRGTLLFGREMLKAVVAEFKGRATTC